MNSAKFTLITPLQQSVPAQFLAGLNTKLSSTFNSLNNSQKQSSVSSRRR